jgi:hypothetical protein
MKLKRNFGFGPAQTAFFMLRVLQNFPLMFQRFRLSPGGYVQHARDMNSSDAISRKRIETDVIAGPAGTLQGRTFTAAASTSGASAQLVA